MSPAAPQKRNTSFKGDVIRLVSGTALAQGIGLAASPILTRFYAPDAFGIAALFASITAVLGVLACMRYELSIVLPVNDREAANLLAVSIAFTGFITILMLLLVLYGGKEVVQLMNLPELEFCLWLVPLAMLIHGIFMALNYWNTRNKHFMLLSIARVTSKLATTITILGAGFGGYATGSALIAASLGGQAVATTVLAGKIWRDNGRFIVSSITMREMWAGIAHYRKFPIYGSLEGLLNSVSWQLPVLILGIFFSSAAAGFYALGFRILQIPMSLIGGAVSQVFHQRASEAHNNTTLAQIVESLFKRLFLVALFPMLMLMIIGRDLYIVIFGEQWAKAGVYTQILSPWVLIWFVSSPMSNLFGVMGRQEQGLKIQVLIFLSRLIAMAIGAFFHSSILAISLFSASGAVVYGYLVILVLLYAGVPLKSIKPFLSKSILGTAIYLALALAAAFLLEDSIFVVLVSVMLSALYLWSNRLELKMLMQRG
jgi:lipopolysaccharide exporter